MTDWLTSFLTNRASGFSRRCRFPHLGEVYLLFFPVPEQPGQPRQQLILLEVAGDRQHDVVGVVVAPVEFLQVVAADVPDGADRGEASQGVSRIEGLGQFAIGDPFRVVVLAAQRLDGLVDGELDPVFPEGRGHEDLGEEFRGAVEVFREGGHGEVPRIGADARFDGRGHEFQFGIQFFRGRFPCPAAPHDRAGEPGQADLVRRFIDAADADVGGHVDERKFVVFQQVDDHAVRQDGPFAFRYLEFQGGEGHGAGGDACPGRGTGGKGHDGDKEDAYSFPGDHCCAPSFLVINPTVRFSSTKYFFATRATSAGVTAATFRRCSMR